MPIAFIQCLLMASKSRPVVGKKGDKRLFKTDTQVIKSSSLKEAFTFISTVPKGRDSIPGKDC